MSGCGNKTTGRCKDKGHQLEYQTNIVKVKYLTWCHQNIRYYGLFVHANSKYLTLPVGTQNPICCFMFGCHKNCLARDTVYIDWARNE